ncbi:similar to Saccharomyces cerevisiae YLR320W MMS22 Protein [Maudiozyma barnettii]|uniref:Similar to Saccharomyces cerevisiae YLR320W MMS22 Protein n=1 Tax=Maudiozyma barnettii TaxID=61262 RepID=A0A8H2ZIJ6_9SACH|nr:Mms22p [Kazachstania barnettii]CAB4255983.1 similar to Saccharomyces cerevisiae YLR320W MMS22 Protein [Kazachstania barnettii]CAD1784591.1 similar to Saccharomyces cerevisiae YLR320W MMS22 Protein [Kazachstania barnettii]
MDVESYLVSDSEELSNDEVLVLYDPNLIPTEPPRSVDDLQPESPVLTKETDIRSEPLEVVSIPNNLDETSTIQDDQTVDRFVNNGGRILRKRTAIQKLPYSLERIKHRQQLQGFDVSNFETVSNKVKLPPPTDLQPNDGTSGVVMRDTLIGDSPYISGGDDDGSDFSDNASEDLTLDLQEAVSQLNSFDDDNDDDLQDIIFRGKHINMKTGYRGILPRSAWERELKKNGKQREVHKRKNSTQPFHKGVAIKKKHSGDKKKQDDLLLSEMAIIDDDTEDDVGAYLQENTVHVDQKELERFDNYYRQNYNGDGSISDKVHKQQHFIHDNAINNIPRINEIIDIDSDGFMSDPDVELMTDYESEGDVIPTNVAEEDNGGIVNAMLTKSIKKRPGSRFNGTRIGSKKGSKISRPIYRKRRSQPKIRNKIISRPRPRDGVTKTLSIAEGMTSKDPGGATEKKDNGKERTKRYKRPTNSGNSFLTVVEALGNKYSAVTHKGAGVVSDLPNYEMEAVGNETGLPILDILLDNKLFEPPGTVILKLSNKKFVLSRYNLADVPETLVKIFGTIVNEGVSDMELLETNKLITEFIFHLNDVSLLLLVQRFHREFRSRVYSVLKKAKAIHFYELAVCQLLLLEISQYTNTPNVTKQKVGDDVINNTVAFFILLSDCYTTVKNENIDLLYQSYDILATVIDIFNLKDKLWDNFNKKKLPAQILQVITAIFPIQHANWEALDIQPTYTELMNTFKFIKYCRKVCKWEISDKIVLTLNDIFKRRRFQDFYEEKVTSERNYVIGSSNKKLPVGTLFNKYLTVLRGCSLSLTMSEKIMPIGEISMTDDDSIIINRMNLLIVLASEAKFNLDQRLWNLIEPLIPDKKSNVEKSVIHKRRTAGILNAILAFLKINASKKYPFRLKNVISRTYSSIVMNYPDQNEKWNIFLKSLDRNFDLIGKSKFLVLKDLGDLLQHYLNTTQHNDCANVIIKMIVKNLMMVKVGWLQKTILPVIKNRAEMSIDWIGYYCKIAKHLIDHKLITWWAFYTYQGLNGQQEIQVAFNLKVVDMCDNSSFSNLRESFFKLATKLFLKDQGIVYRTFLTQLFKRDTSIIFDVFLAQNSNNSTFSSVKIYFSALKRHNYTIQMIEVIDQIEKMYTEKLITSSVALEITTYLNERYADEIKSSHSFVMLKRHLHISDIYTERSLFRDTFKSYTEINDKIFFLEKSIVESLSTPEETLNTRSKLGTLFDLPRSGTTLKIFKELIEQNMNIESSDLLNLASHIISALLEVINSTLKKRFYQIDRTEIYELTELCRHLTIKYKMSPLNFFDYPHVEIQVQQLLSALLKSTESLSEYDFIVEICKSYCHTLKITIPETNIPERRLIEFLEKQNKYIKGYKELDYDTDKNKHLKLVPLYHEREEYL